MFEPIDYMRQLHGKLKTTKDTYKFDTASGIAAIEGVVNNARRHQSFFVVDDSQDGITLRKNGAYYERRPYTVFILCKVEIDDMPKRQEVLTASKKIYRSLISKMIKDKLSIPIIDLENIKFHEVPPAFATGCSGLYFIFSVDNPVNLVFNAEEWDD